MSGPDKTIEQKIDYLLDSKHSDSDIKTLKGFFALFGDDAEMPSPGHKCTDEDYMFCAMKACLSNEPLHFHHDGCPACYNADMTGYTDDAKKE